MVPTHPELFSDDDGAPRARGVLQGAGPKLNRTNRGPAAAAANRDALLEAARTIFASRGLDVPLSTIAQQAGVGQGVLYRHFPSRIDFAVAIFEENKTLIEKAATGHAQAHHLFQAVWRQMVDLTVSDVAFIETVVSSPHDPRIDALNADLAAFLTPLLNEARARGTVPETIDLPALYGVLRAAYGLVITHTRDNMGIREEVECLISALGLPSQPG
ncbi:MAG: TetR/AcrR family transcriptional regulator [Ancrocorticia sp.]|uniref:TetR/AcrR family transcriptional regulator n=1 Tax=Ancrocorticia sp. TaxID=2593684 RepID=UPI003F90D14E